MFGFRIQFMAWAKADEAHIGNFLAALPDRRLRDFVGIDMPDLGCVFPNCAI